MANLTRDDVLKLARLARIELSDDEIEEFTGEFSEILAYMDQLQSADIAGLEPTSQVTGLINVTRSDEVKTYGYLPQTLLNNAPSVHDGQLKVKRMIG